MGDKPTVIDCIYAAIDEVNEQLPAGEQIAKAPDTRLSGNGSTLDSLGVINLMFCLEREVEERLNAEITLSDRLVGTEDGNPFASVGELTNFIDQLVRDRKQAA